MHERTRVQRHDSELGHWEFVFRWNYDIARQRQQELIARAERDRLARIARDQNALGRTGYCKKACAALLAARTRNSF